MILTFIAGIIIGLGIGSLIVFLYVKKIWKRLQRQLPETDVTRATVNAIIKGDEPKGEFIKMNPVTEYIKNHEGEIKLDDVIDIE